MNGERVAAWPVWAARLANLVPGIRWTRDYCAGGCGRPVDGSHVVVFDAIGAWDIRVFLCQLGGDCERRFLRDPRDAMGVRYSEIRPLLAEAVAERTADCGYVDIAFGR